MSLELYPCFARFESMSPHTRSHSIGCIFQLQLSIFQAGNRSNQVRLSAGSRPINLTAYIAIRKARNMIPLAVKNVR
jgi:hypothetical protein